MWLASKEFFLKNCIGFALDDIEFFRTTRQMLQKEEELISIERIKTKSASSSNQTCAIIKSDLVYCCNDSILHRGRWIVPNERERSSMGV